MHVGSIGRAIAAALSMGVDVQLSDSRVGMSMVRAAQSRNGRPLRRGLFSRSTYIRRGTSRYSPGACSNELAKARRCRQSLDFSASTKTLNAIQARRVRDVDPGRPVKPHRSGGGY